jgi:long-chain acyl-CoA synthetase
MAMTKNFGSLIKEKASFYKQKALFIFKDRSVSYEEFQEKTSLIAAGLEGHGLKKGDRVAVHFSNCLEIVESYFAIGKAGAIAIPLNPMFTPREIKYVVNNSGARFLITSESSLATIQSVRNEMPSLEEVVVQSTEVHSDTISYRDLYGVTSDKLDGLDVDPDSVAMILYTSGTTGDPKGAMLTHNGLITNAEVMVETLGFRENDRSLCVLPLFHLFATAFDLLQMMCAGASTVIIEGKFDAETACQMIEKHKATVLIGVPTIFIYLINHPGRKKYDLTSLRIGDTGGGPVPVDLKLAFEKEVGMFLAESYGLTEMSPVVSVEIPGKERRIGSCGLTLPGLKTRVVDQNGKDVPPGEIGELVVSGAPHVMKGYWNMPDETAKTIKDGWLYTGDLVKKDKDGYIYVVDRVKDMIICGGYNIYPKEIEMVLYSHPAVLEAAVVQAFDNVKGEIPKAYIVLKPGDKITEKEMNQFCRENLAAYKVPRAFEFVESLPKTVTGKIRKVEMRKKRPGKTSAVVTCGSNARNELTCMIGIREGQNGK